MFLGVNDSICLWALLLHCFRIESEALTSCYIWKSRIVGEVLTCFNITCSCDDFSMSINYVSVDSLIFRIWCLFNSEWNNRVKTAFSHNRWNLLSVTLQQIFLSIRNSLSILIISSQIRSWVIHHLSNLDSMNVFEEVLIVLKLLIIQQLHTHRVILLLKLRISKLLIPWLHIRQIPIINLVAHKVHEHVKHDVSLIGLSAQRQGKSVMRRVDVGLLVSVI